MGLTLTPGCTSASYISSHRGLKRGRTYIRARCPVRRNVCTLHSLRPPICAHAARLFLNMEGVAGRYAATSICTNASTSISPLAACRHAHLPRCSGGTSERCGKLQSVHILLAARFHISQSGGPEPPHPPRSNVHMQKNRQRWTDRDERKRRRGKLSGPSRLYSVRLVVRAVKISWTGFKENLRGRWRWWDHSAVGGCAEILDLILFI